MSRQEVIRIMCPNLTCQKVLAVPSSARGKLVRCKHCSTSIRVPAAKKIVEEPKADQNKPAA